MDHRGFFFASSSECPFPPDFPPAAFPEPDLPEADPDLPEADFGCGVAPPFAAGRFDDTPAFPSEDRDFPACGFPGCGFDFVAGLAGSGFAAGLASSGLIVSGLPTFGLTTNGFGPGLPDFVAARELGPVGGTGVLPAGRAAA